jgi:hypothetical protein
MESQEKTVSKLNEFSSQRVMVKLNLKINLAQTMKAQRGSRGITVLFL